MLSCRWLYRNESVKNGGACRIVPAGCGQIRCADRKGLKMMILALDHDSVPFVVPNRDNKQWLRMK